jgi:hypothetical protein
MIATQASSDSEIRARLLSSLGIHAAAEKVVSQKQAIQPDKQIFDRRLLGNVVPTSEPLKVCKDDYSLPLKKDSKIQFDSSVKVVHIPSHSQYSSRIKKHIWSNPKEIKENANRNLREFASEGWDWNSVVEEDEMFLDKFSKEFIHPAHLNGILR